MMILCYLQNSFYMLGKREKANLQFLHLNLKFFYSYELNILMRDRPHIIRLFSVKIPIEEIHLI